MPAWRPHPSLRAKRSNPGGAAPEPAAPGLPRRLRRPAMTSPPRPLSRVGEGGLGRKPEPGEGRTPAQITRAERAPPSTADPHPVPLPHGRGDAVATPRSPEDTFGFCDDLTSQPHAEMISSARANGTSSAASASRPARPAPAPSTLGSPPSPSKAGARGSRWTGISGDFRGCGGVGRSDFSPHLTADALKGRCSEATSQLPVFSHPASLRPFGE